MSENLWPKGSNQEDWIDYIALGAGAIFGMFTFGVMTGAEIHAWETFSLDAIAYQEYDMHLTWAGVIVFCSSLWIVGTNQIGGANYQDWELVVIGISVLLVPIHAAVPAFSLAVDSHLWLAWGLTALQFVSMGYVSWTE